MRSVLGVGDDYVRSLFECVLCLGEESMSSVSGVGYECEESTRVCLRNG
jgi:hypothetical protein